MCFAKAKVLRPPDELADTDYTYSYVSLLSKITFFFVTRLLYSGSKQPLQLEQLGSAPPVSTLNNLYRWSNSALRPR